MTQRLKHDQIFRKSMENPLVSHEFLATHLPKDILALMDISTVKLENTSFVELDLTDKYSDVIFSAKFNNTDGYIYLLLEHQSTADPFMALRLFRYMLNICDRYLTENQQAKYLPIIYPLIYYNGIQNYNVSRNLWNLFQSPQLAREFWTNDYQLVNVHEIPDEELKKRTWSGILDFFMKHINERELLNRWQEIAYMLPEIINVNIGYDYIEMLLCYTLTKIDQSDKMKLEKLLTSKLSQETGAKIMGSLAHHWEQIGEARGEAKGIQIGKIEVAKKMLAKGSDPAFISTITGLDENFILSLTNSKATYKSKL